ncbi:poly(A)-specific ribonuclease PARN-like isoform X2 [Lineus longissimus]|uniref:poly(A)-specific ribonuclease PARN-like isoform X2 n=1 Tax=Lineus longissimus TaxID=88925 RepID=UPI00315DBD52
MEVTRKNFQALLPDVSDTINECDFLAIDGEFTGLHNGIRENAYDTARERYLKFQQGCPDFLLIQFGLCCFRYDDELKKNVAKTFNFYTFPRPFSRQAPDHRFLCQCSSMEFLITQGFDFNKLFREGIPYLSPADEQKLKEALGQKHQQFMYSSPAFTTPGGALESVKSPAVIPDEQKEFIESVIKKIENFVEKSQEPSLSLDPCSAFRRKLIYQTAKLRFQTGIHLETRTLDNRVRCIVISRVNGEEDMRKKEYARQQVERDELEAEVGFSKVIKMISKSGKLMVGHNMLLDLLHVIHQFSTPLPPDYDEFKTIVGCVFPKIIDTKLMASIHPFREHIMSSNLGDLQKILECSPFRKPEVVTAENFPSYDTQTEKLHEAGYDAYITGLSFIGLANYLGNFQDPRKLRVEPNSSLLEPFLNKIFVMRIADIPYINLTGPDLDPNRDYVFHVTFPAEWRLGDLQQLFSPFGMVNIAWIDDKSAFVGVLKKENVSVVMKTLSEGHAYKVTPYYEYMRRTTGQPQPRKRKHEEADIQLPAESIPRKTLNVEASPFVSRRSITPIPEEKEDEEGDAMTSTSAKEELGEPMKKKHKANNGTQEETKMDYALALKKSRNS